MKKKMIKKDYGSVTVFMKEGKITKVIEDNVFNPSSFIDSAEKPINHLVVKSNKPKVKAVTSVSVDKKPTETNNVDKLVENPIENSVECDENKG